MKDGVLVIDKPAGITSHDVVLKARRFFRNKKVGHAGTLDPLAVGVLPLLIGEATKLSFFLMKQEKEYVATVKFGEETDTADSEGKVTFRGDVKNFDEKKTLEVIKAFTGKIEQIPPHFSAIKKNGVPLYKLARKGIEVEIKPREVEIKEIKVLQVSPPCLTFKVVCSSGTYIRALCRDIGRKLGYGGHLTALNRIRSGDFSLDGSIGLKALEEEGDKDLVWKRLIPMGAVLKDMPCLEVEKSIEDKIRCGRQPRPEDFDGIDPFLFNEGNRVRFMSKEGKLISIAEVRGSEGELNSTFSFADKEMLGTMTLTFKLLRVFN
ncbi:MAG: tRNA pseudouridine(55) synthase TruB [Thermodesulfobacteriota bacterium]